MSITQKRLYCSLSELAELKSHTRINYKITAAVKSWCFRALPYAVKLRFKLSKYVIDQHDKFIYDDLNN